MPNIGDKRTHEINLYQTEFAGKTVFKVDENENHKVDNELLYSEGMLVKRNQEDQTKWEPVTSIDEQITYEALKEDYGIAYDGRGIFGITDKTIDPNEVTTMRSFFEKRFAELKELPENETNVITHLWIYENTYNAYIDPPKEKDYAKLTMQGSISYISRLDMKRT